MLDPFVLGRASKYYLFGTASPAEGFQCYESTDLVDWKLKGWAWHKSGLHVARGDLRAPQVFLCEGMFCFLYSGWMGSGIQLGLAASTRPEGPFHDLHVPWLSLGDGCTAGDVFIEKKVFLTFSQRTTVKGRPSSAIFGVALSQDLSSALGKPVKLLEPTQPWELGSGGGGYGLEAPRMFKLNGRYYLTYSVSRSGGPSRGIGYATADRPRGPWTKSPKPLFPPAWDGNVPAPERCAVFRSQDGSQCFALSQGLAHQGNLASALLHLNRLLVQPDGRLQIGGPVPSLPQAGAK